MKFRFTNPRDQKAYGEQWFEFTSMDLTEAILLEDRYGLNPAQAGQKAKEGNAVMAGFLIWANLKKAGLNVSWDNFQLDTNGLELDGVPEPEAAPEDVVEGVPGVDPTPRRGKKL